MNETNTASDAEFDRIVAAVGEALRAAGFGRRKRPRPPPLGYSLQDAAAAAGVGKTTIYSAVRNGELGARKRGTRTIVLASDLKRWLEGLPHAQLRPEA
ncbi:MAG TPA: helix-turn-helix domain-containing protein [Roseiarcus sp.]